MVELASGLFCDEGAALGRHVMRVVVVPVSRNRDPRGGTVVAHVASVRTTRPCRCPAGYERDPRGAVLPDRPLGSVVVLDDADGTASPRRRSSPTCHRF